MVFGLIGEKPCLSFGLPLHGFFPILQSLNYHEQEKQIEQLQQTIAESKLAIENLRKVIVHVESRLKKVKQPETQAKEDESVAA